MSSSPAISDKAQHDSVRIWTLFSRRLASVTDQAGLCAASAKSDLRNLRRAVGHCLAARRGEGAARRRRLDGATGIGGRRHESDGHRVTCRHRRTADAVFAVRSGRRAARRGRRNCGNSIRRRSRTAATACVCRCAPENRAFGVLVLADRINGAIYTVEELELLKCIGDQMTSVLLNLRLASEVARAKELEAFRTMSAFFVHDLKNAAASLNLMLKNLPVHFDDPAFREDALRGIGNTARRIDDMIARLSALRQRPDVIRRRSRSESTRERGARPESTGCRTSN